LNKLIWRLISTLTTAPNVTIGFAMFVLHLKKKILKGIAMDVQKKGKK